jgi:serine/threonine protein kinase
MDLAVDNLGNLLKRSRLVSTDEVPPLCERFAADVKDKAPTPVQFARWLVQQNVLTEYQASLLAKGLVDDFFLGEYKILERVGRGRMAGVYKAQRPDGGLVAIKVLPPSRTKVPSLMARFQRETSLARTFDHPNVVRSLDVGESRGLHYLVMELLDGETVEDVLVRRKRLPAAEAVGIIHQVLLGLQHLHERGVVHRDLKPSNMMLVPVGKPGANDTTFGRTVKILDIGLARRMFEESTPADKVEPTGVTQEGVLLGTPDYLSPEQARDPRVINIRSDIYSLGCVLFHLLTGQTPFPDDNILNLVIRHATETCRPLSDFVPGVPDGIQQIVSAMMAKRADQRYENPAAAAAALAPFLATDATVAAALAEVNEPAEIIQPPPGMSAAARAARQKRTPLPELPENFELVPLDRPVDPSPFAPSHDEGELIVLPRRRRRKDRVLYAIGAGLITVVAIIGFVLTMMARR